MAESFAQEHVNARVENNVSLETASTSASVEPPIKAAFFGVEQLTPKDMDVSMPI
jgi:hypothetical protein